MFKQKTENAEFDTFRVDTIRNQLDEDKYILDIQQIAAKMIDIELALLGDD